MKVKKRFSGRALRVSLTVLLVLSLLSTVLLLSGCGGSEQSVKAPKTDAASCGANVQYEFNGTLGRLTIKGTGDMTDFESGSKVPWADYAPAIKKLVIEEGVTSIGDYAFYYCTALESVNIKSKDLTSIGACAFWMNKTLPEIEIPATVTEIGAEAFAYCASLQSISAESLASLGSNAFRGCTSLEVASISGTLTEIPAGAFANCASLKTVATGESVKTWNETALENTGDVEKTVIKLVGKLTIRYVDADGKDLVEPPYEAEYAKDAVYSVPSPAVEGYTIPAGKETISGTMPGADLEIKVVYVKNAEETTDSSETTGDPSADVGTSDSGKEKPEETPIIFLVLLIVIVIAIIVGAVLLVRSGKNITKDSQTVRKNDPKKNTRNGKGKKK